MFWVKVVSVDKTNLTSLRQYHLLGDVSVDIAHACDHMILFLVVLQDIVVCRWQ